MTRPRLGDSPAEPGARPARLGTALSLSLGAHLAAAIVVALLATGRTPASLVAEPTRHQPPAAVVWLQGDGLTGGGDGGGEGKKGPIRSAQAPGPETIAIPVARRSLLKPAVTPAEPDPPRSLAHIQPVASGLQNITGLLQPVRLVDPGVAGPGFGPGVGPDGKGPGIGSGGHDGIGDGPLGGGGAIPPEVTYQVKPQYTNAAVHARIQGAVLLDAVVLPDGSVGDVTIVRSLDRMFGLDEAAIRAVRQWKFRPARRLGKPIPMLVAIELTFTLR